jgi:hypothetical protein
VLSPGVEASGISISPTSAAALAAHAVCGGPVYVVWFGSDEDGPAYLQKPAQLARTVTLTPVARLDDGTLFSLAPNPDAAAVEC